MEIPEQAVLGGLFRVCARGREALDRIESGYRRVDVAPLQQGRRLTAFTYVGRRDLLDDALIPFAWYQALVVQGAEALGFPESYVARLRSVAARDPEEGR